MSSDRDNSSRRAPCFFSHSYVCSRARLELFHDVQGTMAYPTGDTFEGSYIKSGEGETATSLRQGALPQRAREACAIAPPN